MACSLRGVVVCGIILAIIDILHGLCTLGFYGYRFLLNYFFLCNHEVDVDECTKERYIYQQMFELRTNIGLAEGGITPLFDIMLIVALVKHLPCLAWMWLLKCVSVIGINVFYISAWVIRGHTFNRISAKRQEYEIHYLLVGGGLTIAQVILMLSFCIIGGIFTYRVSEERKRSRRSLHRRSSRFRKTNNPSAPPLGNYEDEEEVPSYHNHALHDSTNKLPLPGSNGSIDRLSHSDGVRQPTEV